MQSSTARTSLPANPKIDPKFEEVTEGEEVDRREKLKSKWAQLEAVVGPENRIRKIASDLVDHFENRLAVMEGKAIVLLSPEAAGEIQWRVVSNDI